MRYQMPPKKKARVGYNTTDVFVITASTAKEQVPKDVRVVRIDGSVRVLPPGIFRDCQSLEEVIFEEGIHTIGERAFCGCSALTKVKFPSTLRKILGRAFYHCKGLCSIDLPVGLQIIGEYAFYNTKLRHLEAPATVEKIEKCAFAWCQQLEFIVLPPRLVMIAHGLFMFCDQLREILVPATVKSIGSYAFSNCKALARLDLSHCIHHVAFGSFAFQNCEQLLQHRFDDLPLHQVCHFSSYFHPVAQDTIEKISDKLKLNASAVNMVDVFGMTPLHILALSQWPKVELFQRLHSFENMALSSKDRFGSTPLDYLCKNPFVEGMRATRWLIGRIVRHRASFLGLDRWKQALLTMEDGFDLALDVKVRSKEIQTLFEKVAEVEFPEVLSLMEMKLWKITLDEKQVHITSDKCGADRDSCRVQSGISIVVGNVLPFLGKEAGTTQWVG
mmetsp:Transcript_36092/g.87255  ORF Transcript_36092/g.87255 Transcript_36092/m.87255 type:complete len:445 (-) Transcript_36092:182-1516(-)